jgi:hypothetical protein
VLPTLAASGDSIPCPHHRAPEEEEKEESTEGATSAPPLEPEAARGDLGRLEAPRLDTMPSLLPLHRAAYFHTGEHASPHFTDAFTSARSHLGEDRPSPLICGCPGLQAEGERRVRRRACAV